jgi:hypothetical protein
MAFSKIVFVAVSIFVAFDDESSQGVGAAFIVPSSSTAPPGESLSFASSLFQKQQRMSEANFRLDYIQGINRSSYNKNKKISPSIAPVEDADKNEHTNKEGTLLYIACVLNENAPKKEILCVCVCVCNTYNAMQYHIILFPCMIFSNIKFLIPCFFVLFFYRSVLYHRVLKKKRKLRVRP